MDVVITLKVRCGVYRNQIVVRYGIKDVSQNVLSRTVRNQPKRREVMVVVVVDSLVYSMENRSLQQMQCLLSKCSAGIVRFDLLEHLFLVAYKMRRTYF